MRSCLSPATSAMGAGPIIKAAPVGALRQPLLRFNGRPQASQGACRLGAVGGSLGVGRDGGVQVIAAQGTQFVQVGSRHGGGSVSVHALMVAFDGFRRSEQEREFCAS